MKVGDTKTETTMELIADLDEYLRGEVRLNHPRHGRVVVKREGGVWRVTAVQYPEGKPR